MKRLLLFLVLLIGGYPLSAMAQTGYLGADGFFNIKGVQPYKTYLVDFGGMPLIRAGNSNSCGVLRIAGGGAVKLSDRIEIHDIGVNKFYGFENDLNIPVKEYKCTTGNVKPEREIWKDSRGTIFISGLTPSHGQTIRLLSDNPKRRVRSNGCGFISIRLGNPQPLAILLDNLAFNINSSAQGGGISCRRNVPYSSYPPPSPVPTETRQQWTANLSNIIPFAPYTSLASFIASNSPPSWSIPTVSPPPLLIAGNNPPPPPPLPEPPYGQICTVAGTNNVFVKQLQPNTLYEFSDLEFLKGSYPNYRSQSTDSLGNTTLLNMNFSTISSLDGEPNRVVTYINEEYDRVLGVINSIPTCN